MPNVQAPDGSVIQFPDAMPMDQISAVMRQKYPPADNRSLFQKAKDNFNANTQGAKPGDGVIKGALENFGAGAGDVVRAIAHPVNTISATMSQGVDDLKNGMDPVGMQGVRLAQSLYNQPARTLGQVGTGAILGEGAGRVVAPVMRGAGAAVDTVTGKISNAMGDTPVNGQNYTSNHAAAFEGAIAPATAMGRNFIPQNVTTEALTPIRNTAARMAAGDATSQGIVKAATAPSTPPLERVGAYQNIVQSALNDLEQQHAPALAQSKSVPVDTAPIVKELQAKISPTMAPADVSAIRRLIMRAKQASTIGDLDTFRRQLNTETAPEYKQSQVQAGRSGITAQATSELADFVRDAYYDNLQKATGTDYTGLKRQEANLLTAQEALQNQQASLAKAEATFSAPSTLREKAGEVANIIKDPKTGVTQTVLRESPATKVSTLLRKSLTDLPEPPTSTGVPGPPAQAAARAQLPAQAGGAYPMPSGSSAQMTPDEQVAAIMHEIRQRRDGQPLGLPAQSGARTILPNNFDTMTPGEQSAALMHLLRTARQAALPANASPIRLPSR